MKKLILALFLFLSFLNVKAEGYLTNILVDGVSIKDFSSEKKEYNLDVDSKKDTIKVVFVYDKTKYKGSGSSENITLKSGFFKASLYSLSKSNFLKSFKFSNTLCIIHLLTC